MMVRIKAVLRIHGVETAVDTEKDIRYSWDTGGEETRYLHCYRVDHMSTPRDYRAVEYSIRKKQEEYILSVKRDDNYFDMIHDYLWDAGNSKMPVEKFMELLKDIVTRTPKGSYYIMFKVLHRVWYYMYYSMAKDEGESKKMYPIDVVRSMEKYGMSQPDVPDNETSISMEDGDVGATVVYENGYMKPLIRQLSINGRHVTIDTNKDLIMGADDMTYIHYAMPRNSGEEGFAVRYELIRHAAGYAVRVVDVLGIKEATEIYVREKAGIGSDSKKFVGKLKTATKNLPSRTREKIMKMFRQEENQASPAQ
jgi:hypothetical protein